MKVRRPTWTLGIALGLATFTTPLAAAEEESCGWLPDLRCERSGRW